MHISLLSCSWNPIFLHKKAWAQTTSPCGIYLSNKIVTFWKNFPYFSMSDGENKKKIFSNFEDKKVCNKAVILRAIVLQEL